MEEDGQFTTLNPRHQSILAFRIPLGQESKAACVCCNKSRVAAVKDSPAVSIPTRSDHHPHHSGVRWRAIGSGRCV